MAFSSSITGRGLMGNRRWTRGTFTNAAGDTGGDIDTGLSKAEHIELGFSSHIGSENPKITLSAGTATIITSDGADGYWFAMGI